MFSPQSRDELKSAVGECLQVSPFGNCSTGRHGPIGEWDVSRIADIRTMFATAESFNQDLSKWDVSHVTNMRAMFANAKSFNQDMSTWDVSRVTDMGTMFGGAESFNQELSAWDVSRVIDMASMFANAKSFNQDLSAWDVSRVIDMHAMFGVAKSFNHDLSKWNVSRVTDMQGMFGVSESFNQDLSTWDVSRVTNMQYMFYAASSFKQTLCGEAWVNSKAKKDDMFFDSPGSILTTVCSTSGTSAFCCFLHLIFIFPLHLYVYTPKLRPITSQIITTGVSTLTPATDSNASGSFIHAQYIVTQKQDLTKTRTHTHTVLYSSVLAAVSE